MPLYKCFTNNMNYYPYPYISYHCDDGMTVARFYSDSDCKQAVNAINPDYLCSNGVENRCVYEFQPTKEPTNAPTAGILTPKPSSSIKLILIMIAPTKSPTASPTRKQISVDSQSPVKVNVKQTLVGITSANFDDTAKFVFKQAVADVLAPYSINQNDVTIESIIDARRRLFDYEGRTLLGNLQIRYFVSFGAQKAGFTDTSLAAAGIINSLIAAVSGNPSDFTKAIQSQAVAQSSAAMQSVTSSNSISAENVSTNESKSADKEKNSDAKEGNVKTIIIAVVLVVVFVSVGLYTAYFYKTHKRCPTPFEKYEKKFEVAPTSEIEEEITVAKTVIQI